MGFIGNWLETSRITVPLWTCFGAVLAQSRRENA
jgi:hypothetical protein